jgi:hypothetical protein
LNRAAEEFWRVADRCHTASSALILGVNLAGFFHITQLAVAEIEKQGRISNIVDAILYLDGIPGRTLDRSAIVARSMPSPCIHAGTSA